jgi:hypothetical protein
MTHKIEDTQRDLSDQHTHQWNRPTPASMFECHVHPTEHDGEVFVLIVTVFGSEAIPVCAAVAQQVKTESLNQHGVRAVGDATPSDFQGTISGVLSTR